MTQDITYVGLGEMTYKEAPDGSLYVYGLATDPTLDLDQQRCDGEWLKNAMPAWFQSGANVREQHSAIAAGVGLEMSQDGDAWYLKSEVVDPVTQTKVRKGVLKGYSIGIKNARVMKSDDAPNGRIVAGDIVEISLVDRPANPSARIEVAKSVNGELIMSTIEKDSVSTEGVVEDAIETPIVENAPFEEFLPCPACGGTGQVHTDDNVWHDCEACDGSGKSDQPYINPSMSGPDANEFDNELKDGDKEVDADLAKREFTDKEREEAADKGQALPDGSYPIKTVADLKNAIQSFGRAKDKAKVKAHIIARAKALGKENLIPENWEKAVEGDVTKFEHDPDDLAAVRQSLINLINAELEEMADGEEDEICDVSNLLTALSIFMNWWESEANENETAQPYAQIETDDSSQGDDMAYIGLGVSADLIKSATTAEATDEIRAELRSEIVKALGLDDTTTKAALSEAKEEIELLKAELSAVKEMAAPGGPALRQTQNQALKSSQVDQLRTEAQKWNQMARTVTDPSLKAAYGDKALKIERDADALAKSL